MGAKISTIRSIRVTTGYECNCACRYCTQRVTHLKDRQRKGEGNQIQSLYILLKQPHIIKSGDLEIELEGGEPLLKPDIIKEAVKLCDQMKTDERRVRYNIVSNCQCLNTDEGREIIRWMADRGCNFGIAVSFDHEYKNPRILRPDTYRFMQECGADFVYPVYVIEDKRFINRAKQNIEYLNSIGMVPEVYWNFFDYKSLNDKETRRAFIDLLQEVKTRNKDRTMNFSGTIESCGWIGITPYGQLYTCTEANFGEADLSKAKVLTETLCKGCEIKDYCKQCDVRKALYGENLCGIVKARYTLQTGNEVE